MMQLMELVRAPVKPPGLHIFLLRLVLLSFVKLSTEKVGARHHGRALSRASRSSEKVPQPAGLGEFVFVWWWFHHLDVDLQEIS